MSGPPLNRELSPTSTLQPQAPGSDQSRTRSEAASTDVDITELEKKRSPTEDEFDEKAGFKGKSKQLADGRFEDRGIHEVEDEGEMKQVRVVMEQKSGKELIAEMSGGPYTTPRW